MPVPTEILDAHWSLLLRRIHQGQCVAFLGAGVNAGTDGYEGLPLGRDVALKLLQDLVGEPDLTFDQAVTAKFHKKLEKYGDLKRISVEELARVALRSGFVKKKGGLVELLQDILEKQTEPSQVLRTIASMPFKLIVTTNYDRLLEKALKEAEAAETQAPYKMVVQATKKSFDEREWYTLKGALDEWLANRDRLPDGFGPIVYKIHGSFQTENPKQAPLVITEEDYLDFLTLVSRKAGGVPRPIEALLQTSTLLFLGYSLEDWDFRTIYKGLAEDLEARMEEGERSIAIQRSPSEFWVDFWAQKDIAIYDIDLYGFCAELEARYKKYVDDL